MNYFRFSKLEQDLAPISAIKEEDEGEIESRHDLLTLNQKTDLKSPKRRMTEDKSDLQPDLPDYSSKHSSNQSQKSKRLGYKVAVNTEAQFPLFVRGLESEKSKEKDYIKKKSLKEPYFHQSSFDEDKELGLSKSESIINGVDDEDEENFNIKNPSIWIVDDQGSYSSAQPSPFETNKIYNSNLLESVVKNEMHFRNRLYLALFDNTPESSELVSGNLIKPLVYVKDKEEHLIDLALAELKLFEHAIGDTTVKNLDLKRKFEKIASENKKVKNEVANTNNSIKTILSGLNDEKISAQIIDKNLDDQLMASFDSQKDFRQSLSESTEESIKVSEQLKEIEETWNMNINDLKVNLFKVNKKRIKLEIKAQKNQELAAELKKLSSLASFQRDQIDFCLEMIVKTMDFFAESKEHTSFNVIDIQMSFKESLKMIKIASQESLDAMKSFENQATKDPRELIPYTRVSDNGPGTNGIKQERLSLSNKINHSKLSETFTNSGHV